VLAAAEKAREAGATRFCMGAAWREVKDGPQFDRVLEMVRGVKALGLEACCTLGMLTREQAQRLKEAGCDAYNHNLDTSREKYGDIISTRDYDDRLRTLRHVRAAGITVCCGGIIGMGESIDDRCAMLQTLAAQDPQPESVPINMLVQVRGTPLFEVAPKVGTIAMVRSAGRDQLSAEAQLLCMMAGANSVFFGDKLLTTGNPAYQEDLALFEQAGISPLSPQR
jgi:biotin synthase